jgi:hypothetical protein
MQKEQPAMASTNCMPVRGMEGISEIAVPTG